MNELCDRAGDRRPSRVEIAALMGICLTSVLVRCLDLSRGLWLDELHTSWVVTDSFYQVSPRAISGNQSPVYFYGVWLISFFLGQSEITLRLISVTAGFSLSFFAWWLTRKITSSRAPALLAAALIASDPFLIEYSQEARPYALLQLLGLFQIYYFAERMHQVFEIGQSNIQPKSKSRRIGFILSAIASFYIHFTAMLLTLSMLGIAVGWSVFGLRKFSHQQFKLLLDFMAIFLACLPLLGIVLLISERRSNWELFVNDSSYRDSIFFQCWAYVVPGCFAILVSLLTRGAKNTARKSIVYACCFFLPIILSWISFKLGLAALYHPRYSLIGWSGAVLFYCTEIGIISISPKQSIRKFAFWICVPALGFALSHNHLLWHVVYQKQLTMPFESPWRESVDYLETFQNKQTVFLFPNLIEDQLLTGPVHLSPQKRQTLENYCSFPLKGIYQVSTANIVPRSSLFRPRFHSTDKKTLLDSGRVVLIIRGNKEVQSDILNEFASFGLEMKIFIRKISEKEFPVRGAPGNFISVWKFEVKAEPL